MLYERVDDATKSMFVPRYVIDVQAVSGKQRYRIEMTQGSESSTLTINLVAAPAPSIEEQARDATEYPHSVTIELSFLVLPRPVPERHSSSPT